MPSPKPSTVEPRQKPDAPMLAQLIKARALAAAATRRGICLLNAGRLDDAAARFSEAIDTGCGDASLASLLAVCYRAGGQPNAATALMGIAARTHPDDTTIRVRHALGLWSAGDRQAAVDALRAAIRHDPECAEYHFQLGTLLTSLERYEEAELRFTQTVNIDRDHRDAMISLAMCCGLRGAPTETVTHLRRAQTRYPGDARVGLMLAQALKAVQQQGLATHIAAHMPEPVESDDARGIEELSRIIEQDPDFVDAFLAISVDDVHEDVYALLLRTIEAALERQPEHAEMHFHCGRLLDRLGKRDAAIAANERAIQIEPSFTRALIELARLYMETDRCANATTRLEQAIRLGAEYADVYYMLGNLYRDQGRAVQARDAYTHALVINDDYDAARQALEALPT